MKRTADSALVAVEEIVAALPKVELHVHLEGCLPPEMALEMARRNDVTLPYATVAEMRAAQDYGHPPLQNFLAYHYGVFQAIRTAEDVRQIANHFVDRSVENATRHVEIYVCLQDYLDNGIALPDLAGALEDARRHATSKGLSVHYIYGANRGLPPEYARDVLRKLDDHPGLVAGVGICSEEEGRPPALFGEFFALAKERGYRITAHCDCDQVNSVEHIRQCIQDLPVERIDHGINILESADLMAEASRKGIHFALAATWRPSDPLPRRAAEALRMAEAGLSVSLNSDDPEEFASGYLNQMYAGHIERGTLTLPEVIMFITHAVSASWAAPELKHALLRELDAARHGPA